MTRDPKASARGGDDHRRQGFTRRSYPAELHSFFLWKRRWFLVPLAPIAAAYVYVALTFPQPDVRIVLRAAPVLPIAIWAAFFDPRRPLERAPVGVRLVGRSLLVLVMVVFAAIVLGLSLNWVFDPGRGLRPV